MRGLLRVMLYVGSVGVASLGRLDMLQMSLHFFGASKTGEAPRLMVSLRMVCRF